MSENAKSPLETGVSNCHFIKNRWAPEIQTWQQWTIIHIPNTPNNCPVWKGISVKYQQDYQLQYDNKDIAKTQKGKKKG